MTELHGCPVTESRGQEVIHPAREQYLDVAKALADEGYTMALDVCGVDYLQYMERPLPDDIVMVDLPLFRSAFLRPPRVIGIRGSYRFGGDSLDAT